MSNNTFDKLIIAITHQPQFLPIDSAKAPTSTKSIINKPIIIDIDISSTVIPEGANINTAIKKPPAAKKRKEIIDIPIGLLGLLVKLLFFII